MPTLPIPNPRTSASAYQGNLAVNAPEVCPVCGFSISLKFLASYLVIDEKNKFTRLEVVLVCPRDECQRLFVAHYDAAQTANVATNLPQYWELAETYPVVPQSKEFEPPITDLSSEFVALYNESLKAEQYGLTLICGAGYRKSLEFLVKDFAKKQHPQKGPEIEKAPLASCIATYISQPDVKLIAARAAWLGNDETHYVRKWPEKDLEHLKQLIDLTVYWISMVLLSAKLKRRNARPKIRWKRRWLIDRLALRICAP